MLKYLYKKIIFSEIPNQVTLGISLSGCQIRCPSCNQRELWEDKGTPLDIQELDRLLDENKGVTCLLLLGGEADIDSLTELFQHAYKKIKTAWYCGLDFIPKEKRGIVQYLDWVKLGHYDPELGGLDSPTTNQRLYKIPHRESDEGFEYWTDITNKFQNNGKP